MSPPTALALACAVLGLAVGSFLNVVIWRVPRGESVVSPPSACPACGARVRPRDNVPVLSWLLLRGRCRDCAAPISARYPLVELGTALAFAGVAVVIGADWSLPAWLYLTAVAVALALIDVDVHRLPDAIVKPSYVVAAVLLGAAALADHDGGAAVRALVGMVALYAVYAALAVAVPGGMGWGDVKLAGLLGLYLGSLGWGQLVVGAFSAFVLGGALGLALVVARRAGRRSAIPFGPFMLAGAFVGLVAGGAVASTYVGLALA